MTLAPLVIEKNSGDELTHNFVEVAFARTRKEADAYFRVLRSASIACEVEAKSVQNTRGVALLADAAELVRATELLSLHVRMYDDDDLDGDDDDEDEEEEEEDDDYADDDDDDDYADDDDDDDDADDDEEEEEEEEFEEDDDF